MSRYRILDEAVADLDAAMRGYEEQREGLGRELPCGSSTHGREPIDEPGLDAVMGWLGGPLDLIELPALPQAQGESGIRCRRGCGSTILGP